MSLAVAHKFLVALGASEISHSGRTLLDHLRGTSALLNAWGCPEYICLAGLFHSIYGTSIFTMSALSFQDRRRVAQVIGTHAEGLAYLFCSIKRPFELRRQWETLEFSSALTGDAIKLDRESFVNLIVIECANIIDQGGGRQFMLIADSLNDQNGFFSPAISAGVRKYLRGVKSDVTACNSEVENG